MKKNLQLFVATLCLWTSAFAALPPAEKMLPDDTLAVLTVPDFTKFGTTWQTSPIYRFWNDDSMKPFRDKFAGKLKDSFLAPLERDLGIKFENYTSLPQGQLTFAVIQDGWQPNKPDQMPALLLLLDTKTKSGQLKTNLADLRKKWVDSGKTVKREQIRDIEFSAITVSGEDLPKSATGSGSSRRGRSSGPAEDDSSDAASPQIKTTLYIGQSDSLLLVGTSTKALGKVLSAMSGGSVGTLAEVPAFSANYSSMFREADSYGWANLRLLVGLLKNSISAPSPIDSDSSATPDLRKIVSILGLDGLRSAAFSSRSVADGAHSDLFLSVPEDARSGLFKLFAGESKECNPPAFVPADVTEFERYRLDVPKLWDGIRKMVRDVNPAYLGTLDLVINSAEAQLKEKNPDFDLKKDLIGNFGDDFIAYRKPPKGNTLMQLSAPPTIYLLGSPHPDQLIGALTTLLGMSGGQAAPKQRDFLGHKIYSISTPGGMPAADATGEPAEQSLNFSTTSGYLAISQDTGLLEEYLRNSTGTEKSLRDLPGMADASQKVIDRTSSLFGYSNERESFRSLFAVAKKELGAESSMGTLQLLAAAAGIKLTDFKDWVDVSLLPDFDRVSKYFGFGVFAGGPTPDGLIIKSFTPTPSGLK